MSALHKFSDRDWELFRNQLPAWRENFARIVMAPIQGVLDSDLSALEKTRWVEERLEQYSDHVAFQLSYSVSRDNMEYILRDLVLNGVTGMHKMGDFSESLQEEVRHLIYTTVMRKGIHGSNSWKE